MWSARCYDGATTSFHFALSAGVRRRRVHFYFARLTARCGLRVVLMARPLHFILHFRRAFDAAVCISISRDLLREVVCAVL
jgi:hypothetical protein